MERKSSSTKRAKRQTAKTTKMNRKLVLKQHNEEIISEEELENRGGIVGNKTEYFNMYLRMYFGKHLHYHHLKTLSDLAEYIYYKQELYHSKHNGFKLMEYSSILTELSALSKFEQELLKEEKEEKRIDANRYKSKKS